MKSQNFVFSNFPELVLFVGFDVLSGKGGDAGEGYFLVQPFKHDSLDDLTQGFSMLQAEWVRLAK